MLWNVDKLGAVGYREANRQPAGEPIRKNGSMKSTAVALGFEETDPARGSPGGYRRT
jgi:hypothetical protein